MSLRFPTWLAVVSIACVVSGDVGAHSRSGALQGSPVGIMVDGWHGSVDPNPAPNAVQPTISNTSVVSEGDGIRIVTGPAALYWQPSRFVTGEFSASATFTEASQTSDHPHPYGLFVGGNQLGMVWTSGVSTAVTHQPWAMKDDERVWATNTVSNDITELDAESGAIRRTIPTGPDPVETVTPSNGKLAYVSIRAANKLQIFDLETGGLVDEVGLPAPENLMISGNGKRILASVSGRQSPNTYASIVDTSTRSVTTIGLPGTLATHNDMTNNGKYGFVSLEGPPHGVAVIDIDKAVVLAFYGIPSSSSPHGVRWAPSCQ